MSLESITPVFQIKYFDPKEHRHLTKIVVDEATALQHVQALRQEGMVLSSLVEMAVRRIAIPGDL
ncbi:MAG: hypothetical protein EOO38_06445 [Cytophagaceae bacterium]|nr:MAG: hypothetical protein EOO38_06445 [Cytophagaceae bacterium]